MSKTSTLIKTVSFAAGLGIAFTSAQAANINAACMMAPCVYDSRGTIVGIASSYEMVERYIHNKWYWMFADADGFTNNTMFFYTKSNCSGQPYVQYTGAMPPVANFDGATTIWGPGPSHAVIKVNAWSLMGAPNPTAAGACSSYGENYTFDMDAANATVVDTAANQLHPPFSVR
jgi:hypothetical protein